MKKPYFIPVIELVEFKESDIIRTSIDIDENQGEWDEQ